MAQRNSGFAYVAIAIGAAAVGAAIGILTAPASGRDTRRKLGRKMGPRLALYKNLMVSVLRYERVKTTEAKAKEISGQVEKVITLAKRGDLSARRAVVAQFPNEPLVVNKLFDEIAPKYADRSSGFTRIVKIGQRRGDAAEIVQIELV